MVGQAHDFGEAGPRSFSAVDAGSPQEQRAHIYGLDLMAQIPAVRRLKAWALERLAPQPGMTAVDVGCGTGEDALGLAAAVTPDGYAIGVDASGVMIAEARRRADAAGSAARFEIGRADALPFQDASVDLLRAERVLQHVPDPEACVVDMHRVLRPGGRVALIDTDWRSLTLWPGDAAVTSGIRDGWLASSVNPAAGSQLLDLLALVGFTETVVTADVALMRPAHPADQPPITLMAANAVRVGVLSQSAVDSWLGDVRVVADRGGFIGMVTVIAAAGRRGTA